jgi:hypothetical protein
MCPGFETAVRQSIRSVVAANSARSPASLRSQNPWCTLTKSSAMEDAGGSLAESKECLM